MRFACLLALLGCGHHDPAQPDAPPAIDASADALKPDTVPRLVIADAHGVRIWNHADQIAADRPPDATLGGVTGALGLAAGADALYVTASGGVFRFTSLADGALPAATIDLGAVPQSHTPLQLDAHGDLWIDAGGALKLVANGALAATFTHPYGQIAGMAYDAAGGRLFGGQISGAGFLAWNAAATRTGTVPASDFVLDAMPAFHVAIAGSRMYASSYAPPNIAVWDDVAALAAPTAPAHTLAAVCGGGTGAELRYVTVTHDDVLVALHDERTSDNKLLEKVCLFRGASTLTQTRAPDAVAEDAALAPTGTNTDKAVLTADGRLYVLDATGITIFADALGTPTRIAKLAATSPTDVIVLE